MSKCASCGNAIWDPTWGEYKCKSQALTVYDPPIDICEFYKKGEPSESKESEPEDKN